MTFKKTQENLVERMLKMQMNMIIHKKANVSASVMRFQISRNFEKIDNFWKQMRKNENFRFSEKRKMISAGDEEALYESSVRKLG